MPGRLTGTGKINLERRGDVDPEKYLTTYTADISNPFWICGVKDCRISFPHQVGFTEDHNWKHVFADAYYSEKNPGK